MTRLPLLLLPLALAAVPALAQEVDLSDPARMAADRERDAHSKPLEVFDWIDVEPGDVVVDFHAGGGYNTWILSQRVGPSGVVFAESPAQYADDLKARLASGDLKDAGNVIFVESVQTLPADSVDVFFVSRNYHDVPAEHIPDFLAQVDRTLKPGGTLAVIDARAATGRDVESHRIADQVIIDEVTNAGFGELETSELLANSEDDHVGPKWDMREQLDQSLMKFSASEGGMDDTDDDDEDEADRPSDDRNTRGRSY